MLKIPAIDILGGRCVRLLKGDYKKVTYYSDDPLQVAKNFCARGAEYLHIVDLDGAKAGRPINFKLISKIIRAVKIPVQVGGGIRSFEDAKKYLENGAGRIIIGTSAIVDSGLIKQIVRQFGQNRLVIAIDTKNGKVATNGWQTVTEKSLEEALKFEVKSYGVKTLLLTDITRDGCLNGPNLALAKMANGQGFRVIVAGGIASQDDLEQLEKAGNYASVIGKAIYEGKIAFNVNTLARRIIPCLDIINGRVVKGTNFKNLKDAGDPVELAMRYAKEGADELVFLDITATIERRETLYDLVRKVAEKINIPFTVGGGIKSLADIRKLLRMGADKVSIGSYAVKNPRFIAKAVKAFGSQCIVISLDCKKDGDRWKLFVKSGRVTTGVDAVKFAKEMQKQGAGELLVNSLDRDGTKSGYDIALLKAISEAVNIPVIASSGAGNEKDFLSAFQNGQVDAVLAASVFHRQDLSIGKLKRYLCDNSITVRI